MTTTIPASRHREIISGLDRLIEALRAQPELPFHPFHSASLQVSVNEGNARDSIVEVQRLASLFGTTPEWTCGQYRAEVDFGAARLVIVFIQEETTDASF